MFAIVVIAGLFLLHGARLVPAQPAQITIPSADLHPAFYLENGFLQTLSLTDLQQELMAQTLNAYSAWVSEHLPLAYQTMRQADLENWRRHSYQSFFDEILEPLDESQRLAFRQFITAKYYHTLVREGSGDDAQAPVPWLHPDVANALGLDGAQIDHARHAVARAFERASQARREIEEDFFKAWQEELFAELTAVQRASFRDALGPPCDLPPWVKTWSQQLQLQSNGPWFLRDKNFRIHVHSGSKTPSDYLLLASQQINGPFEWLSLWELLKSEEVQRELALADEQVTRIYEWSRRLDSEADYSLGLQVTIHVFEHRITIRSARHPLGWRVPEEPINEEDDERTRANQKKLEETLDHKQRERLRQIWNRCLIELGWGGVPLTFPDWQIVLELTPDQTAAFKAINIRRRSEFHDAQRRIADSLGSIFRNCQADLDAQLTIGQRQAIEAAFGKWSHIGEYFHQR